MEYGEAAADDFTTTAGGLVVADIRLKGPMGQFSLLNTLFALYRHFQGNYRVTAL